MKTKGQGHVHQKESSGHERTITKHTAAGDTHKSCTRLVCQSTLQQGHEGVYKILPLPERLLSVNVAGEEVKLPML